MSSSRVQAAGGTAWSIGLLRVHTIHHDGVKMNIQIQRRSKSLHDGQTSGLQPTAQLALPGAAAEVRLMALMNAPSTTLVASAE